MPNGTIVKAGVTTFIIGVDETTTFEQLVQLLGDFCNCVLLPSDFVVFEVPKLQSGELTTFELVSNPTTGRFVGSVTLVLKNYNQPASPEPPATEEPYESPYEHCQCSWCVYPDDRETEEE